jgi:LacI family transcriptional regulator
MATIKELAKSCGVSVATVSNILNNKPGASDKTRKLVLDMAEKLNYTPNIVAKNLKMQKTRSIGVIAEDMTIFSIPDIIDGITDYCQEQDYQILLTNLRLFKKYNDTYYNREDYFDLVRLEIKKLMEKQVEGIIYVAAHERIIRCIPDTLPIPAIMAYGYSKSDKIPSIVVDDVHGAAKILEYMVSNGHKRIGVITGKPDSLHAQARLVGYQQVLFENGILYDPSLVMEGDWTRISGYRGASQLLEKGVTAIFCMNDLMAGGVYDRVDELGLKAGIDVSIAGYDGRELSGYYRPPLTTVSLPLHDIGHKASELMIDLINGTGIEAGPENVCYVGCELQVRKSVKDITL